MEVLKSFEEEFEKLREDLGFKATLDELDSVFYLRDFVQQWGFVSTNLDRVLSGRIRDTFQSWLVFLHRLSMPNPSYMPEAEEAALFESQREEQFALMHRYLAFITDNSIIGLQSDQKRQAEYFDEAMQLWNETKEKLIEYHVIIRDHWSNFSNSQRSSSKQ